MNKSRKVGDLTQEYLRSLLEYDPKKGLFRWKIRRSANSKRGWFGDVANHHTGYYYLSLDGRLWGLHRLAFLYVGGYIPEYVDHINNRRCDNSWENLRATDRAGNNRNASLRVDNKSGIKGVSWRNRNCKWVVQISLNSKVRYLGLYDDLELAELVAQEAREKYHGEFANHGD